MPSSNKLPLTNSQFNSTATLLTIPVVQPQFCDEEPQLLAKLVYNTAGLSVGGSGSVPNSNASAYQASTIYYLVTTGAGSTPSNLASLTVLNNGPGEALFAGQPLPASLSLNFEAAPGTKLNSVSYNASGNSLLIGGASFI